jgi:hypothetical protein
MTTRSALRGLAIGTALAVPDLATAAPYPTNRCVSVKQQEAGRYCRRVLKAWGTWATTQDSAGRDAAIQQAGDELDTAWARAEAKSLRQGSNCADTTLARADAQAMIDAAVTQVAGDVTGGLDLGSESEARCGRRLLQAAAARCGGFLRAEGQYIRRLAEDPDGAARAQSQARARANFIVTWTRQVVAKGCPTGASQDGLETLLDGLNGDVVRDTTISPHLDDTQFTTISPTGSTSYLGREFTPVCMNGSPYSYFVKRGTVNKLLMYYQGGGACWEQLTCSLATCDTNVSPGDNPNNAADGFADRANPANPFRDWNIVFVSYCSCDIHFGDAAQDYPLHVEHRGYHNSRVAEKFAREHFVNPEVVFVTGSSAGAYGAWFNGPLHHEVWPASQFHVLADAGNGVITQDFLETYFPNWNFEGNLPPDLPELQEVLDNGSGIPGYTEVVANEFPNTNWAHYSTAHDGSPGGQSGFYNLMLNDNDPLFALTWWQATCAFYDVMRSQSIATHAVVPDNYRYYIGTGSRHTMWGSDKVYTDTTGGVPTIVDWVNAMLDSSPGAADPGWTNVECTNCGLLLPGDPRPAALPPPFEQVGPDVVINCAGSPSGAFLELGSGPLD